MRKAEIWMAGLLLLFSIGAMLKSMELPITWVPDRGPGAGMVPFYLSLALMVMSAGGVVRALLGRTPESRSEKPFIAHKAVRTVTVVILSLTGLVVVSQVGGMYLGVFLFLLFYIRYLGNRSWLFTLSLAVPTPVVIYLFFEKLMLILLPKGFTEPFFQLFY